MSKRLPSDYVVVVVQHDAGEDNVWASRSPGVVDQCFTAFRSIKRDKNAAQRTNKSGYLLLGAKKPEDSVHIAINRETVREEFGDKIADCFAAVTATRMVPKKAYADYVIGD